MAASKHPRSTKRIFTKSYSDKAVERLRRLLLQQKQNTEARTYGIKVDGEFCVYKTKNLDLFDSYKDFVDSTTETIEILLYYGKSNNCNRHIFYLKERDLRGVGVDVEQKIKDAIQQNEKDHLIEKLKDQVERLNDYIEELEQENQELKEKTDLRGIIKDGLALVGTFKDNSSPLAGAPESNIEVEPVDQTFEGQQEAAEVVKEFYDKLGNKGLSLITTLMTHIHSSKDFREGMNELLRKEQEKSQSNENK